MPFPLIPILIGAGIGAFAGGMSGEDGWDWKRAFGGALLGGATGGIGGAAMAPAAVATSGASAGALGGAGIAGIQSGGAATMSSGLGAGIVGGGGLGGSTAAGLSGISGGAAYKPLSYGMGQQAATSAQAVPSADPSIFSGKDFSQLGDAVQGSLEEEPESPIDAQLLREQEARGGSESSSIEQELAAAAERMRSRITPTPPGLRNVEAAKGGMMRVPSGSLTGGLLVGPGTGTSDSISSAIFPDVASKLGASSMQNIQGGGHIQPAALSDGEYVLTAKAVKGFGKQAGAPPGQEREYGSKLLDNVMNQMQRV